jgi:hypothetical protein
VKEFSQLEESEKETYRAWQNVLEGRKLSDEDVKRFLDIELEETIQKIVNTGNEKDLDIFLKMKLEFIRKIKYFLDGPRIEKEVLEQNIERMLG